MAALIAITTSVPLNLNDVPAMLPRLLIVDDSIDNIEVLMFALSKDYDVCFATSGREALRQANSANVPDLILLDIMMPGMDGYETCRWLKGGPSTQNIPVIFVTAMDGVAEQERGFELGAVDYITKPYDLSIVRARIRTHIRLKQNSEMLEKLASVDSLTGIFNRRHLDHRLDIELARTERSAQPLSVLMIDIDDFKSYNDHYGHGAGDECLVRVVRTLERDLRPADLIARYGGEEFVVLMPECDATGAIEAAERLRKSVEAERITHAHSSAAHYVTISIGVTTKFDNSFQVNPLNILQAADFALYKAKANGRNRVIAHSL